MLALQPLAPFNWSPLISQSQNSFKLTKLNVNNVENLELLLKAFEQRVVEDDAAAVAPLPLDSPHVYFSDDELAELAKVVTPPGEFDGGAVSDADNWSLCSAVDSDDSEFVPQDLGSPFLEFTDEERVWINALNVTTVVQPVAVPALHVPPPPQSPPPTQLIPEEEDEQPAKTTATTADVVAAVKTRKRKPKSARFTTAPKGAAAQKRKKTVTFEVVDLVSESD